MEEVKKFQEKLELAIKTKNEPKEKQTAFPTNSEFVSMIKKYKGNICFIFSNSIMELMLRPFKNDIIIELSRPSMSKKITFFKIKDINKEEFIIIEPFINN